MKTKLTKGTAPYIFRRVLEERYGSAQAAAAYLDIPLYRIRRACQGDLSGIGTEDWRKLSPMMTIEERDLIREYVLP